jgi:hypothetical protein
MRLVLTANVDTSPQPYFRLERTAVEAYQMFAPTGAAQPPRPVDRLGLEAYWFPDRTQLMSTDGTRLVTVVLAWRHSQQARQQALAVAASRPYLRQPHPRAGSSLTKGAAAPV